MKLIDGCIIYIGYLKILKKYGAVWTLNVLIPLVYSNLPVLWLCAIIGWRLNSKIGKSVNGITEQQGQYLLSRMHCCICQLNHWNANAKKSQIIKPHRAWQWKLFSLWGVADDDLTTLFDFPLSALILQQTVFEAGPTKLKMEKASLLFHLFVEKISWRFCILSPQKLILINSWKILKRLLQYFTLKKQLWWDA